MLFFFFVSSWSRLISLALSPVSPSFPVRYLPPHGTSSGPRDGGVYYFTRFGVAAVAGVGPLCDDDAQPSLLSNKHHRPRQPPRNEAGWCSSAHAGDRAPPTISLPFALDHAFSSCIAFCIRRCCRAVSLYEQLVKQSQSGGLSCSVQSGSLSVVATVAELLSDCVNHELPEPELRLCGRAPYVVLFLSSNPLPD